jgi:hypothetical protein
VLTWAEVAAHPRQRDARRALALPARDPAALLREVRPRASLAFAAAPRVRDAGDVAGVGAGRRAAGPARGARELRRGIVTDCEGSGAHARVQVNFEGAGSKWLVLAYANLARCSLLAVAVLRAAQDRPCAGAAASAGAAPPLSSSETVSSSSLLPPPRRPPLLPAPRFGGRGDALAARHLAWIASRSPSPRRPDPPAPRRAPAAASPAGRLRAGGGARRLVAGSGVAGRRDRRSAAPGGTTVGARRRAGRGRARRGLPPSMRLEP